MTLQDTIESLPVTGLSGSAGDIVASRNQYGPYFRARTAPTGPLTFRKSQARTAFTKSAALWNLITQAQRDAWEAYAMRLRRQAPPGINGVMTGRDQFMRINCIRYRFFIITPPGGVHDPPSVLAQPVFHGFAAQSFTAAGNVRVWFDAADPWVGQTRSALVLYASPALSASIRFHKAPMRMCPPVWGDPVTPPTSPVDIAWPYPTVSPSVPLNVFARISLVDGRLSRKYYARAEP